MDLAVTILIPVYDDWPSLQMLLGEVHRAMAQQVWRYRILIVDDASPTEMSQTGRTDPYPRNCDGIELLRLRKNLGHQRAIAVGLVSIHLGTRADITVVMDGDGEDAPDDICRLVEVCIGSGLRQAVFARRTRRVESFLFKAGYETYCVLHRLAVGSVPRVGNFSALPSQVVSSLVIDPNLWNHFAAALYASKLPRVSLPTPRGKRFEGKSKLNFNSLVVHGLSALACYSDAIGVRVVTVTALLIIASLCGAIAVAAIRLFTHVAVPGWATAATGILLILSLQLLTLAFAFCLIVLSRRQGVSFMPIRDTEIYIETQKHL